MSERGGALTLVLLLTWVTFAAGGVYPWVWLPWAVFLVVLATAARPRIAAPGPARLLDLSLIVSAAMLVVQLVPVPGWLLVLGAPEALVLRAKLQLIPLGASETLYLPISVVPQYTVHALIMFAGAASAYWMTRRVCERGGSGRLIQSIAVIGIVASVAAIVQRVESRELIYGFWRPLDEGAQPFGPFVNRNHFATWVVMAGPLVFGYLLARAPAPRAESYAVRIAGALRQLGSMRVWMVTALCVMTLAVLISASRSGVIALAASLLACTSLAARRRGTAMRWAALQGTLLVAVVLAFANFDTLLARLDETVGHRGAGYGRLAVWADAAALSRAFIVTGTGAGTFGTAIGAYQTAAPGFSIGHAHNHYLHIAAEGGLLLIVPVLVVAAAFVRAFAARVAVRDPDYLIRCGAGVGIAAVLLQSVWETGLRMPANAMLLAMLAGIGTSAPHQRRHTAA